MFKNFNIISDVLINGHDSNLFDLNYISFPQFHKLFSLDSEVAKTLSKILIEDDEAVEMPEDTKVKTKRQPKPKSSKLSEV